MSIPRPIGHLLREWRQRRRLTQLDCALEAEISTKHLSFLETGRAQPSREMVLRLSQLLDVPLRERNTLLVAAGFAPMFKETPLQDPALQPAREAVEMVLKGLEPSPAVAIDRYWNLVAANDCVMPLLRGVAAHLLQPPMNVLRLGLHPDGLAPRVVNLLEWRAHLLARLERQIAASADRQLIDLLDELRRYPAPDGPQPASEASIVVPLRLASESGVLSFIGTTTVFGAPLDITLAELALESFFPADPTTAAVLRQLHLAK